MNPFKPYHKHISSVRRKLKAQQERSVAKIPKINVQYFLTCCTHNKSTRQYPQYRKMFVLIVLKTKVIYVSDSDSESVSKFELTVWLLISQLKLQTI